MGTFVENYVARNTTATISEQADVAEGVKVVNDVFGGTPYRAYIFCGVVSRLYYSLVLKLIASSNWVP